MITEDTLLLTNIKANLPSIEALLKVSYEDYVYRFYHQSFKVYYIQSLTQQIVDVLASLGEIKNEWFLQIVKDGTGREFAFDDNKDWLVITRPMLEAFFHAHYFLEMAFKYGKELEVPPQILPSGWAAVLYLYGLR